MSGMNQFQEVLSVTSVATAVVTAYALIGFDDAPVLAADAPVKGVSLNPAEEAGVAFATLVMGTVRVKAKGAIVAGADIVSDATGAVKTAPADPSNVFAKALTSAADGEFVTILMR